MGEKRVIQQQQERPIRILIGTPAGGGQVTVQYMLSLFDIYQQVALIKHNIFIRNELRKAKAANLMNEQNAQMLSQLEAMNLIDFEIGIYTLSNESLLTRGRNHIAAVAIRGGWDKLFFIDADAKFNFEMFSKIVLSPYDFAAAPCPLKMLPIHLNFLPFQDDEHYYPDRIRTVDSLLRMREGHKSNWVSVAFIGTAFMCLSRKVLLAMAENSEEYQYPNPSTGHLHTHWNMFATKPMHGKFMSEDWYACEIARSLGFDVMMNCDVCISHVGTMVFAPEMAKITHKTQEQPIVAGVV